MIGKRLVLSHRLQHRRSTFVLSRSALRKFTNVLPYHVRHSCRLVFGFIHEVADLFFNSFLSLREVVAFKVAIAANRRRPQ